MAVIVEHGYTPAATAHSGVTYSYAISSNGGTRAQGVPADVTGTLLFGGGEAEFADTAMSGSSILHYELTETNYADTSGNTYHIYNEYEINVSNPQGIYYLRYTVNGGNPSTVASAPNEIYFAFYLSGGRATWGDIPPAFRSAMICKYRVIAAGGAITYGTFPCGTVLLTNQLSIDLPYASYHAAQSIT